AVCLCS
ncbi:unnamed protein product, partial [Leptidea sinapis]